MPTITHVFSTHQRIENRTVIAQDQISRRAFFVYDDTGDNVTISIIPTLTPKQAKLTRQIGFVLYYKGLDPDYRFEVECWPDNGTIKRLSVYRNDKNVEYRYLSDHQDRMF